MVPPSPTTPVPTDEFWWRNQFDQQSIHDIKTRGRELLIELTGQYILFGPNALNTWDRGQEFPNYFEPATERPRRNIFEQSVELGAPGNHQQMEPEKSEENYTNDGRGGIGQASPGTSPIDQPATSAPVYSVIRDVDMGEDMFSTGSVTVSDSSMTKITSGEQTINTTPDPCVEPEECSQDIAGPPTFVENDILPSSNCRDWKTLPGAAVPPLHLKIMRPLVPLPKTPVRKHTASSFVTLKVDCERLCQVSPITPRLMANIDPLLRPTLKFSTPKSSGSTCSPYSMFTPGLTRSRKRSLSPTSKRNAEATKRQRIAEMDEIMPLDPISPPTQASFQISTAPGYRHVHYNPAAHLTFAMTIAQLEDTYKERFNRLRIIRFCHLLAVPQFHDLPIPTTKQMAVAQVNQLLDTIDKLFRQKHNAIFDLPEAANDFYSSQINCRFHILKTVNTPTRPLSTSEEKKALWACLQLEAIKWLLADMANWVKKLDDRRIEIVRNGIKEKKVGDRVMDLMTMEIKQGLKLESV